jgi:hypothetical protein
LDAPLKGGEAKRKKERKKERTNDCDCLSNVFVSIHTGPPTALLLLPLQGVTYIEKPTLHPFPEVEIMMQGKYLGKKCKS